MREWIVTLCARLKHVDRAEMGCEELVANGKTQLPVTNLMAATAAFVACHALWTQGEGRRKMRVPQEVFFGVAACAMGTV